MSDHIDPNFVIQSLTNRCAMLIQEVALLESALKAEREKNAATAVLPDE